MVINNSHLGNEYVGKINKLISTIPKILLPKNGIPPIHLTKSLFHSFCLMYNEYTPTGDKKEEEFFEFCKEHGVWAFSCMPNKNAGNIYLALEKRLERDYSLFSIEHVIFHEMGHLFYYGNGVKINNSIDVNHETLSDIYANACIINIFNKGLKNGIFDDIDKDSMKIMSELNHIKTSELLFIAESIYRKHGVLR